MAGHIIEPLNSGDDDIELRAGVIAEEFGVPAAQVSEAIHHLVDGLPSPGVDAEQLLRGAAHVLGWQDAFALVIRTSPALLESRVLATQYLSGTNEEIPLYTREDLAARLAAFSEFLNRNRQHLIETGLPRRIFSWCRWLWLKAGKLYPVQRTENIWPFDEPIVVGTIETHYNGVRVSRNPKGPGVIRTGCQLKEADLITGLTAADAERLVPWRNAILDLKLAVLGEAVQFLRSPNQEDLWGRCLPHFKNTFLTTDEIEFLIGVDRGYLEVPHEWILTDSIITPSLGYDGAVQPGGLSNLIELIGHVEKEKSIGTMHKTREALGDLVVDEEGCTRLHCAGNSWPYFRVVHGGDQTAIDKAVDTFCECDALEGHFLNQFNQRVVTSIKTELCRRPRSFAHQLQLNFQTFAGSQDKHVAEAVNIFRRSGSGWEVQFRNGPMRAYTNRNGLFYIFTLLQCQHNGRSATELRSAYHQFAAGINRRSIDSSEEGFDTSTNAGELVDRRALREYRDRLDEIKDELDEARRQNDELKIQELDEEKLEIRAAVRAATGLGGRRSVSSPDAKKDRGAVRIAITRALDEIRKKDIPLEIHLRKSIELEDLFRYAPEGTILWVDH